MLAVALALLGGAASAGPRVAVIQSDDLAPYVAPVPAFLGAVGESSLVVNIHGRRAEAEAVMERLRADPPEVVLAFGAKAAWASRTQLPDVPLVYAMVLSPDRYGLLGDDVYGITATVPPSLVISQFAGFFPEVETVGVLRGPLATDDRMVELEATARELGLSLVVEQAPSARQARQAYLRMASKVDALWLQPDRAILTEESWAFFAEETRRRRMPLLVETDNMVQAGGLFAAIPDPDGLGRQCADVVRAILAGDPVPAEQAPQDVLVVLNVGTVRRAEIPFDPLLLDFVDKVVE